MTSIVTSIASGQLQSYRSVVEFANSTTITLFGGAIGRGRHTLLIRTGAVYTINPSVYTSGYDSCTLELIDREQDGEPITEIMSHTGATFCELANFSDSTTVGVSLSQSGTLMTLSRKSPVAGSNPGCFRVAFTRGDAYTPENSTLTFILRSVFESGASQDIGTDVFLVVGSENAVGFGAGMNSLIDIPHPQIYQWGRSTFDADVTYPTSLNNRAIRGLDPLQHKSNDPSGNNTTDPGSNQIDFGQQSNRIGCVMEMSRRLIAGMGPNRRILLVPCAVGGSGFTVTEPGAGSGTECGNWLYPTGSLVEDAITRCNLAMADLITPEAINRFQGIIWISGENDTSMSQGDYSDAVVDLIAGLRADITNASESPVLIGQLPRVYDGSSVTLAINEFPGLIPNCAVIWATGNTPIPESDGYFDNTTQRELGRRLSLAVGYLRNRTPLDVFIAVVSNLTGTDLDLTWGYEACILDGFTFDVDYKLHADSSWTNFYTDTTTLSDTLSGLTSGEDYDLRVTSNSDDNGYVAMITVTTGNPNVPLTVSGLVHWLDGADPNGNGILPSDGDPLDTWVDKSTQGNDATASGSDRPVFHTNLLNGLGGVSFDGSKGMDFTINGFSIGGSARTILAVYKTNNSSIGCYYAYGNHSIVSYGYILYATLGGDGNMAVNNFGGNNRFVGFLHDNYGLVSSVYDGSGSLSGVTPYVNGSAVTPFDITIAAAVNTANDAGKVGRDVGAFPDTFNGDLMELLVYNVALSGGDLTTLHNYLLNKWNL
jgi:hypothetical protein